MPSLSPQRATSRHAIATSIQIATSTSPRNEASEASAFSALNASAEARAIATGDIALLTTRLALIELLSEPSSSLTSLRSGLDVLDGASWDDLVEERHAAGICPYPTCDRKAGMPYAPEQETVKIRVKMLSNGLFDSRGKSGAFGPFCSARCRARSEWYRTLLGTERREMLEDVEERRRAVSKGTAGLVKKVQQAQASGSGGAGEDPAMVQPPLASSSVVSSVDNLPTGELKIVERQTPIDAPSAPSTSTRIDFERSSSSTSPLSLSRPARTPRAGPAASSALMPFDTVNLAKTVLRSTSARPNPPTRPQPTVGLNGLPPPQWRSEPVMLDEKGRQVEWAKEEEPSEEEQVMMEDGLALMRQLRASGEL